MIVFIKDIQDISQILTSMIPVASETENLLEDKTKFILFALAKRPTPLNDPLIDKLINYDHQNY